MTGPRTYEPDHSEFELTRQRDEATNAWRDTDEAGGEGAASAHSAPAVDHLALAEAASESPHSRGEAILHIIAHLRERR